MSETPSRYAKMADEELVAELKKRSVEIIRTLQEISRLLKEASNVE